MNVPSLSPVPGRSASPLPSISPGAASQPRWSSRERSASASARDLDRRSHDGAFPPSRPRPATHRCRRAALARARRGLCDADARPRDLPLSDPFDRRAGARCAALAAQTPEIAASPYYKTWTAQSPLERMLRAEVARSPQIETRYGWRLDSFVESEQGRRGDASSSRPAGARKSRAISHRQRRREQRVRAGLGIRMSGRGTLGEAVGLISRRRPWARVSVRGPASCIGCWRRAAAA